MPDIQFGGMGGGGKQLIARVNVERKKVAGFNVEEKNQSNPPPPPLAIVLSCEEFLPVLAHLQTAEVRNGIIYKF